DCPGDRFWWTDDIAVHAESASEFVAELVEQVNVLRFFAGKCQESPRLVIVLAPSLPGKIHNERENEFFDHTENAQVRMAADLVQLEAFERRQEVELLGPRKGLRHEWPAEVEPLAAADDVFNLPVNLGRGFERPLIGIVTDVDLSYVLYRNH